MLNMNNHLILTGIVNGGLKKVETDCEKDPLTLILRLQLFLYLNNLEELLGGSPAPVFIKRYFEDKKK